MGEWTTSEVCEQKCELQFTARRRMNRIPAHRLMVSGREGAFRGLGWGPCGMRGHRVRGLVAFSPEVCAGDRPLPRGPHRAIPRIRLTSPSFFPLTFFLCKHRSFFFPLPFFGRCTSPEGFETIPPNVSQAFCCRGITQGSCRTNILLSVEEMPGTLW